MTEFYALGWPSGEGYDIRSSTFKGFAGQGKNISRIGLSSGKSLSIFEGFFDFLAFLTYYKISDFQNSAIMMNSMALRKTVLEEIQLYDFEKIYLFLDNDKPGEDCKDFFRLTCEDIEIVDKSNLYAGYKDFNEMFMKAKIVQKLKIYRRDNECTARRHCIPVSETSDLMPRAD